MKNPAVRSARAGQGSASGGDGIPGVKDRLTDAGYGLGRSVACRLPESWAQRGITMAAASPAGARPGDGSPGPAHD
jgi:hypothetical protein